ncbi:MAG: TIGR04086 family membrane protein [Oscillospiraceae bacterium]|nr:TIGR04086 family membrane protein [Oscillospiraceae bacterium]
MNLKGILRGVIFSYIIAAFVLFLSAVATYFNIIDERTAGIITFGGAIVGVFVGALGAAKTAEFKILINAMAVSLCFIILIIIAASAVNGSIELHTRTWALIGSAAAAGFAAALFAK